MHEMSQVLACWITNTPVVEVNFWTETGGHVVHHKPRIPLVQPFISFAPFAIGVAIIFGIITTLNGAWWVIGLKLILLLIVAATLAPSKADVATATQGLLLILVIGASLLWAVPAFRTLAGHFMSKLTPSLTLVVVVMAGLWFILRCARSVSTR